MILLFNILYFQQISIELIIFMYKKYWLKTKMYLKKITDRIPQMIS